MNNVVKYITILIIFSIIIILVPFLLKFYSFSFKDGTPTNWVVFVEYFGGFLNPILTIINIYIFIKLTISVQRATENKTLVNKTEDYILKHCELFSNLISEVMFQATYLDELKLNSINEDIFKNKVQEVNNYLNILKLKSKKEIYKNHFNLRVFIENKLFKECDYRDKLILQSTKINDELNNFFSLMNGQNDIDVLSFQYRVFEAELKCFLELGKKFSDEIYKIR
jgi:hypothetical protein